MRNGKMILELKTNLPQLLLVKPYLQMGYHVYL